MKKLQVDLHSDKTWFKQVKRGFDFSGCRISPTTLQPSARSVSRRNSNITRLYQQEKSGVDKKCIGQYLRRWSGCAVLAGAAFISPVHGGSGSVTAPGIKAEACSLTSAAVVTDVEINFTVDELVALGPTLGYTTKDIGLTVTLSAAEAAIADECNWGLKIDWLSGDRQNELRIRNEPTSFVAGANSFTLYARISLVALRLRARDDIRTTQYSLRFGPVTI